MNIKLPPSSIPQLSSSPRVPQIQIQICPSFICPQSHPFSIFPSVEQTLEAGQTYKKKGERNKRIILELRTTALRELEPDTTARESPVNLPVGIEAVVNATAFLLVEDNPQELASIFLRAGALSDDFDRVDDVGEDGVVDGGESAGTGTLLGLGCAGVGGALWARQDAAGGDDQDMAVGELLFELAGKAGSEK